MLCSRCAILFVGTHYFRDVSTFVIVYNNKLKEAILGGHHSSIESFKIKQILEQTGDLFDFSDMTFNEKEAQKNL